MTITITEKPHRFPTKVWSAESRQDFINKVVGDGSDFNSKVETMETLLDCWEEESLIPNNLLEAVKLHGKILHVYSANTGDNYFLGAYNEATYENDLFEAAKEYNSHDLASCCYVETNA